MLISLIEEALWEHGDSVAVTDAHTALGYRELAEESARVAKELAAHLGPYGERARVGIRGGNSTAYVVLYLAVLRAGCVPFLLDRTSGPQETEAIAEDCGLDLLLYEPGTPPPVYSSVVASPQGMLLSALPSRARRPDLCDTTQVARFTSGSTGRPHCVEFSGRAVHRAAVNWIEGTGLGADDRILCFASLSNGLAFNTSLLPAFLAGARLHLGHGLPTASRVVRMLEQTGATRLVGFPALYDSLVRRGPALPAFSGLRMAISSAAPLSPETKERFIARTGVAIQNYYGAAEAGPLTFAADPVTDPGLGKPLPGVSLRAGRSAEEPEAVEVRSESMGTRYLNAPGLLESRLTPDGHYRTGDLGYLAGGSLVLTGRTSQVINIGGRKIDAVEVTDVLRGAEGVRDAVVLHVTDRHGGDALAAVLAAEPSLDTVALRRHVGARLAAHKVPTLVQVVPRIPRGSSGKPAMAEIRQMFDR
ncbi:class I adenylate-forming enzyme family protein [Sphaerisporangium sp. NPDC088356]|uniref:class I adenylate-forming enzyme family protein n=1 Tax=Sphaerisporangium sp. NPDC088356 TaxID=3154871 RepID=UPI00342B1284